MKYPCSIKEQEAQPYLGLRTRTAASDLPAKLGQSWGAIMAHMLSLGQQPAGMPFLGYFNEDMNDMDVEMGIPTAEVLAGSGAIYGAEIPAGRVAECLYTGPYSGMTAAYQQIGAFMADEGVEPVGMAYEMYLDDPGETPEAELRTLIVFPLR